MYATLEELRENCANIPNIVNATDDQLTMWGTEAFVRINLWCGQDFLWEEGVTKYSYGSYSPTIMLPKRLAGNGSVTILRPGQTVEESVPALDLDMQDGGLYFRYLPSNRVIPSTSQVKFAITGDWGYETLPLEIKIAFYKITGRIALRDNPDDLRYHNSGFTSESWGDGYSYSLSNAELRSLIHANDAALLWSHQHTGRTVS